MTMPSELPALDRGKARLHLAECEDLHAVAAPALLARQFPHQPVGERAGGSHADALTLEIADGLDRAVERKHEGEICRRSVHGSHPDCGRALGTEAKPR